MSWCFETEREFQEKLDRVDAFLRDEVEPLEGVVENPYVVEDPSRKRLIPPLQAKV